MKRALLWLVGVAVLLIGAAVAAPTLPGSFAWSWLIVIQDGNYSPVVRLDVTCHSRSTSVTPVRMAVGVDQRYMRVHPADLACFELPKLGGTETSPLGPLSETLLAGRFDPPLHSPKERERVRELHDFLTAIARNGLAAMSSSPWPPINGRDAEASPENWFLASSEPGLSVQPRWPLLMWFVSLTIAWLAALKLIDRWLFASGSRQPANNPA